MPVPGSRLRCCQLPAPAARGRSNARPQPPAALATLRLSARGHGSAPPTRPHAGPRASLPRRSLRLPAGPAPNGPAPALAWAEFQAALGGARFLLAAPRNPAALCAPLPVRLRGAPGADPTAEVRAPPPPAAPPRLPGLGRRRRHKGKQHVRPQLLDGGGGSRPSQPPGQRRAAAALQEVGGTAPAKARRPAEQTGVARSVSWPRGGDHGECLCLWQQWEGGRTPVDRGVPWGPWHPPFAPRSLYWGVCPPASQLGW